MEYNGLSNHRGTNHKSNREDYDNGRFRTKRSQQTNRDQDQITSYPKLDEAERYRNESNKRSGSNSSPFSREDRRNLPGGREYGSSLDYSDIDNSTHFYSDPSHASYGYPGSDSSGFDQRQSRNYGPYEGRSPERDMSRDYGIREHRSDSLQQYPEPSGKGSFWSETSGRTGRGALFGRGPKGYQRTDDRIHEVICERLAEDGEIDASDIAVEVANAEVTLSGTVDDRRAKYLAEELCEEVWGVREIHNLLKVKKGLMARLFGSDSNEDTKMEAK